jgi:hypothetical protein
MSRDQNSKINYKINKYVSKIINKPYRETYLSKYNYYLYFQKGGVINIENIAEYDRFLSSVQDYLKNIINVLKNCVTCTRKVCSCNDNLFDNFVKIDKTQIYIADINYDCESETIYIKTYMKKIVIKLCDIDEFTCSVVDEVLNCIKYSKLSSNNICSNYLLFLGFVNKCDIFNGIKIIDNDSIIDDTMCLITNFVEGYDLDKLVNKLTNRQVFEYIYSALCSLLIFNYYVYDIHAKNVMLFEDSYGTIVQIDDKYYHFSEKESLVIIDYQKTAEYKSINPIILRIKPYTHPELYTNIEKYFAKYLTYDEQLLNLNLLFPENVITELTGDILKSSKLYKFKKNIT